MKRHPALYEQLQHYYQLNPMQWIKSLIENPLTSDFQSVERGLLSSIGNRSSRSFRAALRKFRR